MIYQVSFLFKKLAPSLRSLAFKLQIDYSVSGIVKRVWMVVNGAVVIKFLS